MGTFPWLNDSDWCGEWRPQEAGSEVKVAADWLEEKGCPSEWTDKLRQYEEPK